MEKLKAETPQGEVMIQADTESKADLLMKVMDAAREAGIKEVAVATRED
ncbi:MAG: ExbD/TolR family protein [Algiphilus sp.]